MAKSNFTIEIKGIKETFDKVKNNFQKAKEHCDAEMGSEMEKIINTAKSYLPANYGQLRSSLRVEKLGPFYYQYGSHLDYAAYVEFGTGKYAAEYVPSIEPEWQKLALTYKTSRPGRLPKSPYLYPSTKIGEVALLKKLKETIKTYV
jgi:hypothetical protein